MVRSTRVLAIALMATALCADRALAQSHDRVAGHRVRSAVQVEAVAERWVERLARRIRRVVQAVRLLQTRGPARVAAVVRVARPADLLIAPVSLSPFQFRLPPPAIAR